MATVSDSEVIFTIQFVLAYLSFVNSTQKELAEWTEISDWKLNGILKGRREPTDEESTKIFAFIDHRRTRLDLPRLYADSYVGPEPTWGIHKLPRSFSQKRGITEEMIFMRLGESRTLTGIETAREFALKLRHKARRPPRRPKGSGEPGGTTPRRPSKSNGRSGRWE